MFIDLLLRDIRCVYQDIPEVLSESSEYKLISPRPEEEAVLAVNIAGKTLKWGRTTPMLPATAAKLSKPSNNSILPPLAEHLADQKLSCYATNGEARVIDFRRKHFDDMVD
jgi:hypothetical protein